MYDSDWLEFKSRYFKYSPNSGVSCYDTEKEAVEAAKQELEELQLEDCDPELAHCIVVGTITHRTDVKDGEDGEWVSGGEEEEDDGDGGGDEEWVPGEYIFTLEPTG